MSDDRLFLIFDNLEQGYLGTFVRDSLWLFPAIESIHLVGLAVLGGAVIVNDLRLLKVFLVDKTKIYVLNQTIKWFYVGLALLVITGVPLFLSEAIKCFYSRAFWIKMGCLVLGILFTILIRNPQIYKAEEESVKLKIIGVISIFIWMVVAASGRWIGFS